MNIRRIHIFIIVLVALTFWLINSLRNGGFERYLDEHHNPSFNSKIEYYWASIWDVLNREELALYRYKRVFEKYPKTEYAPLAWFGYIDILESLGDRQATLAECDKFLEKYPDHDKSDLIQRKKSIILHGF